MKKEIKKMNSEESPKLKIDMQRVEALMSEIIRQKTMVDRFRFKLSEQGTMDLLAAHYGGIVKKRHDSPVFDENTMSNLCALTKYLTSPNPKFGVLLCGTCGNGKTTLLYALQSAINYLNALGHFSFLDKNFKVGMEIVDAKDIAIISRDYKALCNLRSRSMLAIDDLGKEPTELLDFGNVISPVIDLLEYRYQHQLFTCITSNLIGSQIRDKYGARIADRFNEMLEVIVFQDVSYRH